MTGAPTAGGPGVDGAGELTVGDAVGDVADGGGVGASEDELGTEVSAAVDDPADAV